MIIEILISIFLGILVGTISGLAPGIHINLVNTVMISILPTLLLYSNPLALCIFIISMSITHTFLDTIPSIYLGAPEDEKALGILQGHKMLLNGQGYAAVYYTIYGALLGLILSIMFAPLMIILFKYSYPYVQPYVGYILLIVVIIMILKDELKLWALFIFLISGTLGVIVFSMPNLNEPLFPLLSGLFGVSTLILSLSDKITLKKQIIETPKINKIDATKSVLSSTFAGTLISFLPGMGPSQGAVISQTFTRKNEDKNNFLMVIGGIGTVSMLVSFVTLFALEKARNGSVIAISKITSVDSNIFLIFLVISLIVGITCFFWTLIIAKRFSNIITKINYQKMIIIVITVITLMCLLLSGIIGLLILITSTAIGLIAPLKGVQRSHAMGCLILPVIFYFLL